MEQESIIRDRRLEGDTLLRQCQLVEVYLLDVFAEICKRHNLRYFLAYGTLLGAMRHNGFIPWDDDVDVGMPREDFDKFKAVAADELSEGILFESSDSPWAASLPIARLRDCSSYIVNSDTAPHSPGGIYLDIYPYVRYPRVPRCLIERIASAYSAARDSLWIHRTLRHLSTAGIFLSWCKAIVWQNVLAVLQGFIGVLRMFAPCDWHEPLGLGRPMGCPRSMIADDVLFPLKKHEFEGKVYNVPNDPDAYLTQRYGDWRKLPPEDKRVWHHSIICPAQAPNEWWARPYRTATDIA